MNLKFVVVGDHGVGKTCLLYSYVHKIFPDGYPPTEYDAFVKFVQRGQEINLNVWDNFLQSEEAAFLRHLKYPQTDVVLVCFSVVDPNSFEHVRSKWKPELSQHCPNTPFRRLT
jgi:small GTP-binding protein